MEKDVVKYLCKKYGKSEKLIALLLKICENSGIKNKKQIIKKWCKNN